MTDPGKALTGINYDVLKGYLEGASVGKPKNSLNFYNGVSEVARNGFYPKLDFSNLNQGELEKLLDDSGLSRKFSVDDFKEV